MQKSLPGERIYKRLRARFGKRHIGHIIAIDPKTGRYVLGKDELAVALKAKKEYPHSRFSVFRIGYSSVHKFRFYHR